MFDLTLTSKLTEAQHIQLARRAAVYQNDPRRAEWWWLLFGVGYFDLHMSIPDAMDGADTVMADTPYPPIEAPQSATT